MINGTQGYSENSEDFIKRTESLSFAKKHQHTIHLLPLTPCTILDIGAGTGADAASFAALGHQVVAVEPTDELRLAGMTLHPSERIVWVNDSLPDLAETRKRGQQFDAVTMIGVWMHLDIGERQHAMPKIVSLLRSNGLLILSLRHGPVPPGRRMFAVSPEETIHLAQAHGLRPVLNVYAESVQLANRQAGVMWSHLAFDLPPRQPTMDGSKAARKKELQKVLPTP